MWKVKISEIEILFYFTYFKQGHRNKNKNYITKI
jgi:hypothetical protein